MFLNKLFTFSRAHISKSKTSFSVKSSAYFRMKIKILADFQISISVPLMFVVLGDLETCLELENAGYTTEESRNVSTSSNYKSSIT